MNLKEINNNPLSQEWKKRYVAQSEEVRARLDELYSMNQNGYQLKVIKKSRTIPKIGDIFVLSPRENIYFYGKVIDANIEHVTRDTFIHGKNLIYIFNCKTTELSSNNFVSDYDNLLIPPQIVDKSYWNQGLFFNVGHEVITNEEVNLDYGFYSIGKGKYYKENGVVLQGRPKLLGTYGVATISGIAYTIEKELIINPSLLVF